PLLHYLFLMSEEGERVDAAAGPVTPTVSDEQARTEQREALTTFISDDEDEGLIAGRSYYLLDMGWWKKWCASLLVLLPTPLLFVPDVNLALSRSKSVYINHDARDW